MTPAMMFDSSILVFRDERRIEDFQGSGAFETFRGRRRFLGSRHVWIDERGECRHCAAPVLGRNLVVTSLVQWLIQFGAMNIHARN
jgi:hypothetical protein